MVPPCGNRKRQDTEIISNVPKCLVHFARELQVSEMAGNTTTSESSTMVPNA